MSLLNDQGAKGGTGSGSGGDAGSSGAGGASGNQGGIADWRALLPEDLRSEKVFESIKGTKPEEVLPVLAKNYVHAQRMVGAEKLVIPGDKATPEEWSAFYTKLGRPEKPDDYQPTLPEGVKPEQLDGNRLAQWRKNLHELGLPKRQADELMSRFIREEYEASKAVAEAAKKAEVEAIASLKNEFGQKYDEKLNYARWAVKEFGDKDGAFAKFLDESGLGDHPMMVKAMAAIGEKLSDPKLRGNTGSGSGARFDATPRDSSEAQAAIKAFNLDTRKQKAMWDANDPLHDEVIKERNALYLAAFPPAAASS